MKHRLICILLPVLMSGFGLSAAGQNQPTEGEPAPSSAGANPFIFMWGRSYERILSEIPADKISAKKDGEWIQFKHGNLVCRYSFYLRRRIKAVRAVRAPAGRSRRLMSPPMPAVEYEPLESPGEARLFAVSIHYGPLAMDTHYRNAIEKVLTDTYGRIMNRTRSSYDLENNVTYIRAYLETYRQRDYLNRLVFSSKELSTEMNSARRDLEREATERLKTALARPVSATESALAEDSSIEESETGYMDSAADPAPESASMLEEMLPPLSENPADQSDPVAETAPEEQEELADEPEPVAPPSPSGLKSEELPADFMGTGEVENPIDLP